jgi:hypothetical protein
MPNKKPVYRLAIVIFLVVATIAAVAWTLAGNRPLSAEARRYEADRTCLTRPLSAARRAPENGSPCRVARLLVDSRDIFVSSEARDYVVTFADGNARVRAKLSAEPDRKVWDSIERGAQLDVQFFEEKVSGFELAGRFIRTVGDPSVESGAHSAGFTFIPLALAYFIGIVALFALGEPRKAPAKRGAAGRGAPKRAEAKRAAPKR